MTSSSTTSPRLDYATDRGAHLSARGLVIQTWAMLVDAYRELNAKKLFWITMALSAIVVGTFAAVGFDANGFTIFWKHFNHPWVNTTVLPIAQLYKNLFIDLAVTWWLGYLAIILALVSTAPMFPDFLSGGAVDLYLARPLGRVRLFLTKYMVGLLFVSLQVLVFCLASFLVIGIRGGVWVPGLFLAVPVVVLMFSYLWSLCALFGTLTRSTVAALLLTLLVWFLIFMIHAGETTLLTFSVGSQVQARQLDADVIRFQEQIDAINATPAATQPKSFAQARLFTLTTSLEKARSDRDKATDDFASWHSLVYAIKYPLPKTTETTTLLSRWLDKQFRPRGDRGHDRDEPAANPDEATSRSYFRSSAVRRATEAEVDKIIRSRSATWVIGTSLGFEAAMLALATWVFARRDY